MVKSGREERERGKGGLRKRGSGGKSEGLLVAHLKKKTKKEPKEGGGKEPRKLPLEYWEVKARGATLHFGDQGSLLDG